MEILFLIALHFAAAALRSIASFETFAFPIVTALFVLSLGRRRLKRAATFVLRAALALILTCGHGSAEEGSSKRRIPVLQDEVQVLVVGLLHAKQEAEAISIQALFYEPEHRGWPQGTYAFGVWVEGYQEMVGTFGLEVICKLEAVPAALDLSEENFELLMAAGFVPEIPMVVPIRAAFDRNRYNRKDLYTVLRGSQLRFAQAIDAKLQAGSNYLPHKIPYRLRDRFGYRFLQLETTWSPWGDEREWAVTWAPAHQFADIIEKCDDLNKRSNLRVVFKQGSAQNELKYWKRHLRKSRSRFS